jgi:hypothetical protein
MRDPCATWFGPIRMTGTFGDVISMSFCNFLFLAHSANGFGKQSLFQGAVGESRLGVQATRLGKTLRNSSRTLTAFTLLLARTSL